MMWWSMSTHVLLVVRTKKTNVKPKAGLGYFHAGAHMEHVHMDMLGPFPSSAWGNKYILIMVDQFSKWLKYMLSPTYLLNKLPDVP